jgi:hypothetical protein
MAVRYPQYLLTRKSFIFILSHMRSHSSLLSHILGSHPKIDGYSETHLPFSSSLDLLRLKAHVLRLCDDRLSGSFVLDKCLHGYCGPSPSVLSRSDVRVIFLIREPEPTLTSLVRMGATYLPGLDGCVDYYLTRLRQLQEIAENVGPRALYLTSADLLDRTDASLRFLTDKLGLEQPLTEQYQVRPLTGLPAHGDPSRWIKAGRIVRERDAPGLTIPADRLERSWEAYRQTRKAFEDCRLETLPPGVGTASAR